MGVSQRHLPSSDGHLIRRFGASQAQYVGGSGLRPRCPEAAVSGSRPGRTRSSSHRTRALRRAGGRPGPVPRDVPGEAERCPALAVGRDQGSGVRATADRDEPMTVGDERPVRLQAAVRASARRRPEGREGLERLPIAAIERSPPQGPARRAADPHGDHAVVADHERHRIREGRPLGARCRVRQEGRRLRPVAAVGRPERRRSDRAASFHAPIAT